MFTRPTRQFAAPFAALIVASCAVNPATGDREFMMISERQEIAMGQEYDPQIIAQMGLYPDSALQRYVAGLGTRLATESERPQLPWAFRVVDDPIVNAFAVPGGFIYITRGILAHFNSEAQLVAVLGHEIGHVTARHSASQMSREQLAQIGLAVGSIASERFAQVAGAAGQGLGVLFLKYGRDDENQADALGLRYMKRTTHDVREMPSVYAMLGSLSVGSGSDRIPSWLSSHPAPEDRQQRIERAVGAIPAESIGTIVERDAYLRRLQNLVYGANPRAGYFVGQRFNHPDMRFTLTFPTGWSTLNAAQAVQAMSATKDALIQLTLSSSKTADEALRVFTGREGFQFGTVQRPAINGFTSASVAFIAAQVADTLRGTAMFVEHGGAVFQLLAYGPAARWAPQQSAAEAALRSFAVLTDQVALNIQPQRVEIVQLDRASSITDLKARRTSPLSAEQLARINQVAGTDVLPRGRLVKWVTGPTLP